MCEESGQNRPSSTKKAKKAEALWRDCTSFVTCLSSCSTIAPIGLQNYRGAAWTGACPGWFIPCPLHAQLFLTGSVRFDASRCSQRTAHCPSLRSNVYLMEWPSLNKNQRWFLVLKTNFRSALVWPCQSHLVHGKYFLRFMLFHIRCIAKIMYLQKSKRQLI